MKKFLSTKYNENSWAFGLLLIRIVAGFFMLLHGLDKIQDYNQTKGMNYLFGAPTDGILVIFAELFCAIFLILGLFTRLALIPLIVTMVIAFFMAHNGKVFGEHNGQDALKYLMLYIGLFFTGPGKFSLDKLLVK